MSRDQKAFPGCTCEMMRIVAMAVLGLPSILLPGLTGYLPAAGQTRFLSDLPTFEVEQDLHIDGNLATLVPIRWLAVARNGTIAACQEQMSAIRFFDSTGNDLGTVGGQGEGPGEFRMPIHAGWIGDSLWVGDFLLKRVTLISTEPATIRTLPPIASIRPAPADTARFSIGSIYSVHALYPDGKLLVNTTGGESLEGSPLFQVSQDGQIERLIVEIPDDPDEMVRGRSERGVSSSRVPFYPAPEWGVAPDGSRIAVLTMDISGREGGTFRVDLFDPNGDQIFSRTFPFEGVRIPDQVVDSVMEPRSARLSSRGILREIRNRIPPVYPPVEKIVLGMDGRTWIRLYSGEEREHWLILDETGNPQGRVSLPEKTTLQVAGAAHVWALERDEWDVESIVRYRVRQDG